MVVMRFHKYIPVFLTVIIFILYARSLSFDFIRYWDNEGYSYIEGNKLIQSFNAENIKLIFTRPFDQHYHPLTLISLATDYHLYGPDSIGFRITSLILFALISIFVYFFIKHLTGSTNAGFFVSLFFALHPYNAESLLWLSERKNLLFMVFLIPAFIYYLKYIETGKMKMMWLSALLFFLSLLSKSQGLPFAGLVFVIDYFRQRRLSSGLITEKAPLLLMAGIFLVITFFVHNSSEFTRTHPDGVADYFFSGFRNLAVFSFFAVIPFAMSPYHPYPENGELAAHYWFYPLLIAVVIFLILRYIRGNRLLITGLAFFVVSLFPLLKFFPVPYGNYIFADRYMILPLIGAGIAIWTAGQYLPSKLKTGAAAALLLFFAVSTFHYSSIWKDSLSFYSHLTEKHPTLKSGWGNRGRIYMEQKKYPEAIADFSELIHLAPDYTNAYLNRGLAYVRSGQSAKAYSDFTAAIRYDDKAYKAYSNRALLLIHKNRSQEALADIRKAVGIQPGFSEGWVNKAYVELKMQMADSAMASLKNAEKTGFNDKTILSELEKEISLIKEKK
jgi:tetratricopeptide (TPR) repeat protein